MKIEKLVKNNLEIANVVSNDVIITDAQSAVDLIMTVKYETGVKNMAIAKSCFADNFFVLSSGIAGEVLQKFVNYQFRVAIYGDFSQYTSKPLKDFIFESNKGNSIFFVDNLETASDKLANIK